MIHTNLGRAILAEEAIKHVVETATSYSNLEYDLEKGQRGKRYSHIVNAIKKVVDVPSAVVVNNNAAAVFICLNSLARGKEVIVLVESSLRLAVHLEFLMSWLSQERC